MPSVSWPRGWPALEPWSLGVDGKLKGWAAPGEHFHVVVECYF